LNNLADATASAGHACSLQIPLTESIAAPLLEAERREFQKKLVAREAEFARRADELRRQQDEVAKARESVEEQVRQRLEAERGEIAAAEARKARGQVANDLAAMKLQLTETERLLEAREAKLAVNSANSMKRHVNWTSRLRSACKLAKRRWWPKRARTPLTN
jgi:hypothetical protein